MPIRSGIGLWGMSENNDEIKHASKAFQSLLSRLETVAMSSGENEAESDADPAEEIRRQKYQALFGPRFANKTLENWLTTTQKQERYLEFCRRYVSRIDEYYTSGVGIVFAGGVGTGKTHLSYAIAREIINAGYNLEVKKVIEIMREIKAAWTGRAENEQAIINRYVRCDFLLLEEVGVQYGTENEKIILFDILDGRYKRCIPTLMTTNLSKPELVEYLDFDGKNRLWDRIVETSAVLIFDWDSFRKAPELF